MSEEHDRVYHPSGGEMLTKQSERDSTDVNLIMDSWVHAGGAVAGHLNTAQASYGDFSSGIDYHEALNRVKAAEASFADLPASIRGHVENDPGQFLDMVFDPERRSELEQLGLVSMQEPERVDRGSGGDVRGGSEVDSPPGNPEVEDPPQEAGGGSQKSADPAAGLFD